MESAEVVTVARVAAEASRLFQATVPLWGSNVLPLVFCGGFVTLRSLNVGVK